MHSNNLPELICSRICHDLINPIGAINNGVELMTDLGGGSPELALIGQSADTARAKVEFFRVAFGASGRGQMGFLQTRRVAAEMFNTGRLSLTFPLEWGERQRDLVKLFYLLLLCAERALPRGGELNCMATPTGWTLAIDATKTVINPELWAHLQTGEDVAKMTSADIQFLLARKCAQESDIRISVQITPSSLEIAF